jgi:hypothetical protein
MRTVNKLLLLPLFAILTMGDDCSNSPSQREQQAITEAYATKLAHAEPYPLSDMNDSAERANLRERLLRMNNPNKIGYLYELTMNGQVIAMYTIKGKISSTGSQLTNTQNITNYNGSNYMVVDSMGDDGSYGPEEGGPNGIFFFTSNGVLIEWNGLWQYSDAPLELTSKPLITMNANAQPTTTAGQIKFDQPQK